VSQRANFSPQLADLLTATLKIGFFSHNLRVLSHVLGLALAVMGFEIEVAIVLKLNLYNSYSRLVQTMM
jgi:hypothetical protein